MGKFKIRAADSFKPQVGIFEYLNNKLLVLCDDVDVTTAVGGMVEMRQLFHRDLMKMAAEDVRLDESTRQFIIKNNYNVYRYFPRGRVCYQVNEDKYYIFGPMEVLQNNESVRQLINEFALPKDKIILVNDHEYDVVSRN